MHIQTEEGELIKAKQNDDTFIETMPGVEDAIPLNYNLVHLQNEQGDDIMRYI